MNIKQVIATAGLTIAALAITGGTSYGAPTFDPATVHSVQHAAQDANDVGFSIVRSDADKTVTTTLTGGTFQLTDTAVNILDGNGIVTSTMPLSVTIDGTDQVLSLNPSIADDGAALVAHPTATAVAEGTAQTGSANAATGALIGGIFGLVVTVISLGFGFMAIPAGILLGAMIGGISGSGTPSSTRPCYSVNRNTNLVYCY
ncbi:hypothetical protein ACFYTS_07630 [Nocardia sp. NPDC004151]|uniref:hypothetical protein n=1 Tax=Nocardia sp. NPDC004151 TaxID=3364304 RepID=UPI00367F7996